MTNKKYIRTMSDEELIDWIHINMNFCFNCPAWLNSEVE